MVSRLRGYQLRLEEGLSSLEHHLVVNLKQLVHEQPGSVRALLLPVAVSQEPAPVNVLDEAVKSTQLGVVKADLAVRHAADVDLLLS